MHAGIQSNMIRPMLNRRHFIIASAFSLPGILQANPTRSQRLISSIARLEKINGGRLGVAVVDSGNGERVEHRGHERFPMCSTFKFLLAAAVLQRVDRRQEALTRVVAIPSKPLLFNSPLTEPNAGGTMSVEALCHAILTRSDNTAANLLLEMMGGPPGITGFCRSLGDEVTRLDRMELSLNESLEGDIRDTTTPSAMADDLRSVLLGHVLSVQSRTQLLRWMESSETGLDRLRARLPTAWRTADKTGANGRHTSNDVALLSPPGRAAVVVSAYITQCLGPESKRAAMLAEVGGLVRAWVG